jgi:hypothetical protein
MIKYVSGEYNDSTPSATFHYIYSSPSHDERIKDVFRIKNNK